MAKKDSKSAGYGAKDIQVLEGLDPVRKRPGMYIGSTGVEGLHHLIWEVVDNGVDEAMAGFADTITVKLLPDGAVEVADNGRGIPTEMHPQTKKSTLETVLTTLHAGGKFGGGGYKVSGGLHGVGVSVVNALSEWLKAEVYRDGYLYTQEYVRGKAKSNVKKTKLTGAKAKESGTVITFRADAQIFSTLEYNQKQILERLRQQAYLTKRVRFVFISEAEKAVPYSFYFEDGVRAYVESLNERREPVNVPPFYIEKGIDDVTFEIAVQYTTEFNELVYPFANNIFNPEGGTHLTGFRSAITRSLNDYAKKNNLLKNGDGALTGDDVREGLTAVISVKLGDPQFEGQTKAKLGNPEIRTAVESVMNDYFSAYLEEHPNEARKIIGKTLLAAKARLAARAARDTVIRKGILEGMTLPGKLADCSSRKPEESEIFIVEGDSAGGTAKQGRNRRFQAILPLRGKPLNVEKSRLDKMLSNEEIKIMIIAFGAGIGDQFDIEKIRYHRIVIMTDADVDGEHIRTLLLTFFFRHMPQIIEKGYLYIAQPPLYKLSFGKEVRYAYSDAERDKEIALMTKGSESKVNIQRYKGLGEMNASQLWETTMDPESRVMWQVTVENAKAADEIFSVLMGSDVAPRKKFIQTHAKEVKNLDV